MNKFAFGAALAALSVTMPGIALAQRATNAQIVVVDTGRILRECTACIGAQNQIQGQITALQQRQQTLGTPLQTEMTAIEAEARRVRALPAGPARTAAETTVNNRLQALRTRENTANQELGRQEQTIQSIRAHVVQQLQVRLKPIIDGLLAARNANIVVDKDATLAYAPGLDVTNDVLAQLNQQLPAVSVTPLPQAPAPTTPQPQGR
jgi:Skp family chaperone for outer membrane proteins